MCVCVSRVGATVCVFVFLLSDLLEASISMCVPLLGLQPRCIKNLAYLKKRPKIIINLK